MWTERQRLAWGVVIAVVCAGLWVRWSFNRSYIDDSQPEAGARAPEVMDQIDPNTADWQTLAALPSIGPVMGRRIVEERERYVREHPGQAAYAKLDDLKRVKGIGPATLANVERYLMFPGGVSGGGAGAVE